MRIITNEKTVKRNAKIGQYTTMAAMLILVGGVYVSFAMPDQFYLSVGALLIGFILSQVGIYFGNRWSRRPRVDEAITASLKGLSREFVLYHYTSPVSHLLVGPAGIWVILPYHQRGLITYQKDRWHQKTQGFGQAYMKLFAQEGLGRPDLEAGADLATLKKFLVKELGEENLPPLNAALFFIDPRAEIDAENAPLPTLPAKKFKEFFRKTAKEKPFPPLEVKRITDLFPQEGVEA